VDNERRTVWKRIGEVLGSAAKAVHPEAAAGSPGATLRNVLVAVFVVAVGALAAFGWEWVTAETTARHEAEIAEKLEAERAQRSAEAAEAEAAQGGAPDDSADDSADDPADGSTDDPAGEPSTSAPDEEAEETFDPGIWSYVEAVTPPYPGPGIVLRDTLDEELVETFQSAQYDDAGSETLFDWLWTDGVPLFAPFGQDAGLSNRWNVTLNSTGSTAVTVTDLQLADLDCAPARAAAAFDLPAQGGEDRMLISYSMENPSLGRLYEYTDAADHAPNWGEPFFDHKVISLGGNEEGVGLTVEVVTTDQDCTWSAFELSYQGPDGGGVHEIVSDDGAPFEARGVASDADTFVVLPTNEGMEVRADMLW
jgi:hypothetical protein